MPAWRLTALLLTGLLSVVTISGSARAQVVPSASADQASPIALHIDVASRRFRIPASWIHAVMRAESAHDIRAVSSAGAIGLMQVMPETWLELRARYDLGRDPFDVRDNILAGAAYLREMYDRYGNVGAMLAAYNAGPRRYDEYLAGTRDLPAETRAYVATIAPLLGGDPPPYAMPSTRADPLARMSAPLFVARSDDVGKAAAMHPERQRESGPNAPRMQDGSAFSARSPALFVARGGNERPQ